MRLTAKQKGEIQVAVNSFLNDLDHVGLLDHPDVFGILNQEAKERGFRLVSAEEVLFLQLVRAR